MRPPAHVLAVLFGIVTGSTACEPDPPRYVADADPERGEELIRAYGCHSCHTVPGVPGADGLVGPPLIHWQKRVYIGGRVPNTPELLVAWIMDPRAIDERTAMPDLGVTEADARDMAAYLFTLE